MEELRKPGSRGTLTHAGTRRARASFVCFNVGGRTALTVKGTDKEEGKMTCWAEINSKAIRCGTVEFDAPRKFRQTGQTASNWTEIEVPAGTYEITTNGYWYFIRMEGTVTDEYYVNRLLGHSHVAEKRNIGQPATYTVQGYAYDLAEKFTTLTNWKMDDEWTVVMKDMLPGQKFQHYRLLPPYTVNCLLPVNEGGPSGYRVYDKRSQRNLAEGLTWTEASLFIRRANDMFRGMDDLDYGHWFTSGQTVDEYLEEAIHQQEEALQANGWCGCAQPDCRQCGPACEICGSRACEHDEDGTLLGCTDCGYDMAEGR